ncbi:WYL domain-containing protein [Clostridium tertium]|uniref:HTH domain protein n=2 Tax=Clostridium tertium TaxID=1559 RepID=A0A6N3FLY2_9CLOT
MQKSRLFKILYILLEKGHVTASELAEEFEVSIRTIYRDIDSLSSAGIPIYCTQGKGGGISLINQYVLNKDILSENDQLTIISALQSMFAVLPQMENGLLLKLNALFKQNNPDWIQIDFSRWGNENVDNDKFNIIKSAILNRNIITFKYVSSYSKVSKRKVKPLRLCYKSHAWYLQTYCLEKDDFRTFKINRITQVETLSETFLPILPPPIEVTENANSYPYIKLRFRKEIAYRVYDEFNYSKIIEEDNGDIIVEANLPVDNWLYGYLLSFCGYVDIIEPIQLKNDFIRILKEISNHYINNNKIQE